MIDRPRRLTTAFHFNTLAVLVVLVLLSACAPEATRERAEVSPPARHPWLVVGIDGAEWHVIRQLWEQGELPNLKALAERGLSTDLRTNYGASPVIWTTIATGTTPEAHGITDFVVATEHGDVPVSSGVRKVPAIWNMVSFAGRRVAVLGWWASWPAEAVDGLVVSDRLARQQLDDRVYPPEALPRVDALLEQARAEGDENPFFGNDVSRLQDRVTARLAVELVRESATESEGAYDLVLAYFRGVDIVSHDTWKYFRPNAFPDQDLSGAAPELARRIPDEYAAVDAALGELLAAAGERWNVLVISDHGFQAARPEIVRAFIDFDLVLERLGYLVRRPDGSVDFERSQVYTHASPDFRSHKTLRFGGAAREPERVATRLERDLARVTWSPLEGVSPGAPVFQLRAAEAGAARTGNDLVVDVLLEGVEEPLLLDGASAPIKGALTQLSRISGTHGQRTHGILLAAGPDVDGGQIPERIRIQDITPTLLYGLGLPVARNFAGSAQTELFSDDFQQRSPMREVPAWDLPETDSGAARSSAADEELERELRALGYL